MRFPSGLRGQNSVVRANGTPLAQVRDGDDVVFTVGAAAGHRTLWAIRVP